MLKLKINKKDIEIVEEEYFVRGTVGAKCAITAIDEYWMSDEHVFDLIPFDPQIQESIDVKETGISVALVFKRNDMSSIKVYLIDDREDTNSLETFNAAFAGNDKVRNESEYVYADIPYEVMANKGRFKVGFFMSVYYVYTDDDGNVVENVATTPTLWSENISVKNGTDTDGTTATQYTPTELEQLNSKIATKQDKLIAGDNIAIEGNTISAADPDLSNYPTLKHKHGDYLLYLDDIASQDTITELNLTGSNGDIIKNGTLTIIDGTEPFPLKTNSVFNTTVPWSPHLKAVYKNGNTKWVYSPLVGDSNIRTIEFEDNGVYSISLGVDLQDGVEYIVDLAYSSTQIGYHPDKYKNMVWYFYVAPTAAKKQTISYTEGTWDNIKSLLNENTLSGAPIYLLSGRNIDIKYSPCSQYTAMKDYVDDKTNNLQNISVLKSDISTTPLSGKIPQYDSNLNLQVAYGTYGAGETEVKKWQDGAVPYNLFKNYIDYYDNKISQVITDINTAKRVTSIGVEKGVKYTFDWNAMYFFKSNTGKTDLTLLDSDGNNIIDTLKTSYGVLILPQSSYHRSEWSISADPTKYDIEDGNHKQEQLHGLFAGMTDKTAIITTDKIQMLQFDLDPDKTVSVTPTAESVIVYKIKF